MNPREFLENVVEPNVVDASKAPADLRLYYNAIAAVDSLAAHIYFWCKANAPGEVVGITREDDGFRQDRGRKKTPR